MYQTKTEIMENIKKITLDEMINSDLINGLIEKQDKELAEAGWTYNEVKALADSINK